MCFYTNKAIALKAKKDIVCYKVMYMSAVKNKVLTIYQIFAYTLNKINPVITLVLIPLRWGNSNIRIINEGYHSYIDIHSAKTYANMPDSIIRYIFKCIIPKGSIYYKSDSMGDSQYVSNQIIIKSIL